MAAVVVFHLWPAALPGGYVGVDVFFVISGYLISKHLIGEAERSGRIDLLAFYMRRARRLLPAATLVLALIVVLTPLLLPATLWKDTAKSVIASALYVENWRLARAATDYFASTDAPTPVQHYWSLSVEEQFYILWPGLILLGIALSRFYRKSMHGTLRVVLAAVTAASLLASILATRADQASAYFVTYTRIWELGLGGLLALGLPWVGERTSRPVALIGLIAIGVAAVLFTAKSQFPGYIALLPTIGAGLVIISAEPRRRWSAFTLLRCQPLQFVGDISYSIYLWHWPIIIFYMAQTEASSIGPLAASAIIAATVFLSWLSKQFVEDRFRQQGERATVRRTWRRSAAFVACCLGVPLLSAGLTLALLSHEAARASKLRAQLYPGARILLTGEPAPEVSEYLPLLTELKQKARLAAERKAAPGLNDLTTAVGIRDLQAAIGLRPPKTEPIGTRFGNGAYKVALIGDSHAAEWYPAFKEIAKKRNWSLLSYTKGACLFVRADQSTKPKDPSCAAWSEGVLDILAKDPPDLVIIGAANRYEVAPQERLATWREIERMGTRVAVIADTPNWPDDPTICVAKRRDCVMPFEEFTDPTVEAQKLAPDVGLIGLNDLLCPKGTCPAVIGNVIVWRDTNHVTALFARTMAEIFADRLDKALAEAEAVDANATASVTGQ